MHWETRLGSRNLRTRKPTSHFSNALISSASWPLNWAHSSPSHNIVDWTRIVINYIATLNHERQLSFCTLLCEATSSKTKRDMSKAFFFFPKRTCNPPDTPQHSHSISGTWLLKHSIRTFRPCKYNSALRAKMLRLKAFVYFPCIKLTQ